MSGTAGRTGRERRAAARREQIVAAALKIAETESWTAVTTRRVAEAVDYSQPVIYQHFSGRDELVRAVALHGFVTLTGEIATVARSSSETPLEEVCRRYVDFGLNNPRLYEAMFSLSTAIPFASAATPPELREAFDRLRALVAAQQPNDDAVTVTEFVWATCHGLVSLVLAGRIPRDRLEQHILRVGNLPRPSG